MCGSVGGVFIGGVFSFLPFLQFNVIHFIMTIITFSIIKIITVKCNSLQTHVIIILRLTIRLTILLIFITITILLLLILITFITFIAKVVAIVII